MHWPPTSKYSVFTLMCRIAAHMLLFFFSKLCPHFHSIQDYVYAFINFQKKLRKYSNKMQFYTNPYGFIRNFSTLCLYRFYEIASFLCLLPTMSQYESLEYVINIIYPSTFTNQIVGIHYSSVLSIWVAEIYHHGSYFTFALSKTFIKHFLKNLFFPNS